MDWTPVFLFGLVAGIIIFISSRRHRERMELIHQGKYNEIFGSVPVPKTGSKSLFLGLLSVGIGISLFLTAVVVGGHDVEVLYSFGFVTLFGGAAMLLYWKLTAEDRKYARRLMEQRLAKIGVTATTVEATEEQPEAAENTEAV